MAVARIGTGPLGLIAGIVHIGNALRAYPARAYARAGFALIAAFCGTTAIAQTPNDASPSVTPYRPSVSTPAALSAPGWVELEAGGQRIGGTGEERRDSVPYTLKLAFSPDWGVRINGEAWVRLTGESGRHLSGGGDTGIVLKRRFAIDESSAFGLEAGTTLPVAKTGIGSGKSDFSLNAIYSADLGEYHTDLNLVGSRLGAVEAGLSRNQLLWAASLSRSLDEHWGIVGEFSGTHQRGTDNTSQFLVAASYNVSKSLALDVGIAHTVHSSVSGQSLFAGLTVLVGRLF